MNKRKGFRWVSSCLALCAVVAFFVSCRPVVDLPVTNTFDGAYYISANSYTDIFTAVWKGMNINYIYWDIEPTGLWDDIWDEYKPKFDALGALGTQDTEAGSYFTEILKSLHDGHLFFQMMLPDCSINYSPQDERLDARFAGPDDPTNPFSVLSYASNWTEGAEGPKPHHWDFMTRFIGPKYLDDYGTAKEIVEGTPIRLAQGKIPAGDGNGYIAYLYFNAFFLKIAMNAEASLDEADRLVTIQLDAFLDNIYEDECRGIIFDLRGNSGGANIDIAYLLGPLLEEDIYFAYTRTKKNEGRLNYTPWTPYIIRAAAPEDRIPQAGKIPIAALINDFSISCGELMPMAIKSIPKGHLIGTRTYGATGPRIGSESPAAYKDGSFTVGWNEGRITVTQAGNQTRGKHFENYEGIGVEPDEEVLFNLPAFTNNGLYNAGGADAQLEAAIKHIAGP
jgi:hypothetical protein